MTAGQWLDVEKSRVKTKYTDLPGFSRILVSWLCLEACPAALESAEILFLAV